MKKKISSLHLEAIASVIIIIVLGVTFAYVTSFVTGELEAEWAYVGFEKTNFTIRMLLMFGIAGGGIVWLIFRYAKRAKFPVAIGSSLFAAVIMTMNAAFYYAIPIAVLGAILLIKVREMRRSRRRIKTPKFEGTVPREEIRRIVQEVISRRREASDERNR